MVKTTHPIEDCADCKRAAKSAQAWLATSDRTDWTHQIAPLDRPTHTARASRVNA